MNQINDDIKSPILKIRIWEILANQSWFINK